MIPGDEQNLAPERMGALNVTDPPASSWVMRLIHRAGRMGRGNPAFNKIFWWGRALVTVGLALYLINQVRGDLSHLTLQLVAPGYLFLALVSAIAAVFISVWVWRIMLPVANRPGYFTLLAHYLLGFFYNNFLPGGFGGDLVRAGALIQGGQGLIHAANSVLMARLAGLWSIVLLACFSITLYALETGWQAALPLVIMALGALILVILGSAFLLGAPIIKLVKSLPERWQTWHNELRAYWDQPGILLQALLLSFVIQILAVVINTLMARAMGFSIPFGSLFLTIPLVNLVVLLPVSIGGFGVREGSYYYLLSRFGVSTSEAVLLSLAVYVLLVCVAAVGAAVSQFWVPKNGGVDSCAS